MAEHAQAERWTHHQHIVKRAAEVAAYSAAKAGVIGLSQALALEFKRENVKVNVICPAPMDASLMWKSTPDFDRRLLVKPEAIAELVVLLVPDAVLQDPMTPASVNTWYGPRKMERFEIDRG